MRAYKLGIGPIELRKGDIIKISSYKYRVIEILRNSLRLKDIHNNIGLIDIHDERKIIFIKRP